MDLYIDAQQVKDFTGVTPSQIDLDSVSELDLTLEDWIGQAQEYVTEYVEVEWNEAAVEDPSLPGYDPDILATAVPRTVASAVLRTVSNMVAQAKVRRQGGILNLNEYSQRLIPDVVFTDSIKEDLAVWIGGGRKHRNQQETSRSRGFTMFRVRNARQRKAAGIDPYR